MKKYRRALIAMKALPLHLGHVYLINTALSLADYVDIFLVHQPGQKPMVQERYNMIASTVSLRAHIIPVEDICTDDDDPESSRVWATYTRDIYTEKQLKMPDVIVSSEDYGVRWAEALGIDHVMVDRSRTAYPISGTAVRKDPYANWHFLPPVVKAYYALRIAIVGPESTGKTTLALRLSDHYNTSWVPEYGRLYVENTSPNIEAFEEERKRIIFPMILRQQPEMEDKLAKEANRILICDTELVTTDIWYDVWQPEHRGDSLHHALKKEAARRHYTLYLLSVPEGTQWVDDGHRDQDRTREWFTWEFRKRLAEHGDPVVELAGSWDDRFVKAVDHINRAVFETGTSWRPHHVPADLC
jgi:HTH-type transcriptional repressor of NAD biosynthesis genes